MYIIQFKLYCNLLQSTVIPATIRNVIACVNKHQRNKPDVFKKLTRSYKEANDSFTSMPRLDVDLRA